MSGQKPTRKALGAWYTPPELVEVVVKGVLDDFGRIWRGGSRPVRVIDPACGDGRLLDAVRVGLHLLGHQVDGVGCDVDAEALARIDHPSISVVHADALSREWGADRFDIVIGNPPFLSQMATGTSRGGSSRHGGGPYANAAAEFLSLAVRLADPDGSAIGLVLPQSVLAARDVGPVRAEIDRSATRTWSWWQQDQRGLFDAAVNVCALGFTRPGHGEPDSFGWTQVVTARLGVPDLRIARFDVDGRIADRADLNANFRDEYYALVDAVSDDADGPPLVTSGLIDPGRSLWGTRTVKFAKRNHDHPRVDLSKLDGRFPAWAARKLVPKVLVANQTRVVEAVADVEGAWLPGVPVVSVTPLVDDPDPGATVRRIEAVLTSPVASLWCWHLGAGTGMSATSVRLTPEVLGDVPWPVGDLDDAVTALAQGDVLGCGSAVMEAFGVADDGDLFNWWRAALPDRVERIGRVR